MCGGAGQPFTLASDSFGDIDQQRAPGDDRRKDWREEGVVRTAEHDAVGAVGKHRTQVAARGLGEIGIVKAQRLDLGCPAGTGQNVDAGITGMRADQAGEACAASRRFCCQDGDVFSP